MILLDMRHMELVELTQPMKIKAIVWAAEIWGGACFGTKAWSHWECPLPLTEEAVG